jgi:ornithine cyclodeaminase/alanine dehydrogenase-like protein (mu-crystallin family)
LDPHGDPAWLAHTLSAKYEIQAFATALIKEALASADVVVTATRSKSLHAKGVLSIQAPSWLFFAIVDKAR